MVLKHTRLLVLYLGVTNVLYQIILVFTQAPVEVMIGSNRQFAKIGELMQAFVAQNLRSLQSLQRFPSSKTQDQLTNHICQGVLLFIDLKVHKHGTN